jgi:ABC-2 type transport system ATP-binding protein
MVEVRELVKRYPKAHTDAVDQLSFAVADGEVLGLLGPNGAGKSTIIGMLTTRIRPTTGQALIAGVDVAATPQKARSLLGVVPQHNNLDRSLSIRQNLLFHAAYHGVPPQVRKPRAEALLEQFALTQRADDKPNLFSGGQTQRMMIVRALMHEPRVLFLDEPTTGLDPAARLFVWDRIRELRETGVTILLTTHDMHEAAALADRVGIIDYGRLLALDTPAALIRGLAAPATLLITVELPTPTETRRLLDRLDALAGIQRCEHLSTEEAAHTVLLSLTMDPSRMLVPVAATVADCGSQLTDVKIGKASLEDVFINLTGRKLR